MRLPARSFNEAPIHESGKLRSLLAAAMPRQPSFNEAPIHESGKCAAKIMASLTMAAFNEAPIHESGKFQRRFRRPGVQAPSMRPRFMNRGSQDFLGPSIQPSQAFNEAPIHESGKSAADADDGKVLKVLQ